MRGSFDSVPVCSSWRGLRMRCRAIHEVTTDWGAESPIEGPYCALVSTVAGIAPAPLG